MNFFEITIELYKVGSAKLPFLNIISQLNLDGGEASFEWKILGMIILATLGVYSIFDIYLSKIYVACAQQQQEDYLQNAPFTLALIKEKPNHYSLSRKVVAQLEENHRRSDMDQLTYKEFPPGHPGHLDDMNQRLLADIVQKSLLTQNKYNLTHYPHIRNKWGSLMVPEQRNQKYFVLSNKKYPQPGTYVFHWVRLDCYILSAVMEYETPKQWS